MATLKAKSGPDGRMRHRTIKAAVADELREQIISGRIRGGAPLRQESLAAAFGCSLIPVREALLSLQGEGLVEFVPHKGAVAKEITYGEIEEIFDLRALLECDILSRAVPKVSDEDLRRAKDVLKQFVSLLDPEADLGTWGKLNWDFHSALYAPAGRDTTYRMIQRLHTACDRYIRLQLRLDEGRHAAHVEHEEILALVEARDRRGAAKALRAHILITGKKLIDGLSAAGAIGGPPPNPAKGPARKKTASAVRDEA